MHLRVSSLAEHTDAVVHALTADAAVSTVAVLKGASVQPPGDLVLADVAREAANGVVERLREVGVHEEGAIHLEGAARHEFARALSRVFASGAVMSATALIATIFLPAVDFSRGVPAAAGEQMLAAEMTSLEPEDEPDAIGDRRVATGD